MSQGMPAACWVARFAHRATAAAGSTRHKPSKITTATVVDDLGRAETSRGAGTRLAVRWLR